MRFVKAIWKLLVGIKDALVLLFMLMFFGLLYSALSARPSASCMRSAVVNVRLEEVMTSVRSGELMPLPIWRVVSSSSEDTMASNMPGTGLRLNTGRLPPSCDTGCGNTST